MYTIHESIKPVIEKLGSREKGIVAAYLIYGKGLYDKNITDDELIALGKDQNSERIAQMLNDAFVSGLGIWDIIVDRDDNYGKQLDICVNDVLCKALNKSKPRFRNDFESWEGIIEREKWIVNSLIERFWDGLSDKDKLELVKGMENELRKAGIKYEELVKKIMMGQTSITILRSILGFRFHIF